MERQLQEIAGLMAVAARTAPKSKGEDFIEIKVLSKEKTAALSEAMLKYGEDSQKPNFDRDGKNVAHSDAVLLLALKNAAPLGLDCGACGYDTCIELEDKLTKGPEFSGPLCAWRLTDLGIALGSAVKTASLFNADNRIMYRIGVVALKSGIIDGEMAVGVPISATGKNIYFDR